MTGSKTLVTLDGKQLLVDCGLFQGYKNLRSMNWEDFRFDLKLLDSVVLTHAHLDHSGALPLYTEEDADRALLQLRPLPFDEHSVLRRPGAT